MRAKPHFIHLAMVPVLTFLACNPVSTWILSLFDFGSGAYLKALGVSILLLYGLYLIALRHHERPHWTAWIFTTATALGISWLFGGLLWLLGIALLFSLQRICILELDKPQFPQDLVAVAAGIGAATLLLPVSLPAALAAFFLVQLIYEMGFLPVGAFPADRFQDSYKTADRILKTM